MLKRRDFIAGSLALLASAKAGAREQQSNIKFDKTFDVIIVGSGISSMICANYLTKAGKSVAVIEKMNRIGGNSVISQQDFAVAGSDVQKSLGIQDSPENFISDLNKAGAGYNQIEHTKRIAYFANEAYEFAKSCGIKYENKLKKLGGHSVARSIITAGGGGAAVNAALKSFLASGGVFFRETKCDEILKNENGEVVGLKVREQYYFDKSLKNDDTQNQTGITKTYGAKAVVFATGGFSKDVEFRSLLNPRLKLVRSPSNLSQSAGALKIMLKAGAMPVQLSLTRFSFGIPTEDLIYGILVDKDGKRFMSEEGDRQSLSNKILDHMAKINTTKFPVLILDSDGFNASHDPARLRNFMQAGKLKKFNSLKELADFHKLPYDELVATSNQYEKDLSQNADKFKKDASKLKGAGASKAPFYAIVAAPGLSYTQGGVGVSPKTMGVLDIDTLEPIKGLYAIGEATGGVHGFSRLTSCSIPDCMTGAIFAAKAILGIENELV